jgi:sec-independent protein translocase protein TatC
MAFPDDPQGGQPPAGTSVPTPDVGETPAEAGYRSFAEGWSSSEGATTEAAATTEGAASTEEAAKVVTGTVETAVPAPPAPSTSRNSGSGSPPKPPEPPDDSDGEEDGMAKMSFLEHLEELRKRLLLAVGGIGVAFFLCLFFSDELWAIVFEPAGAALRHLGVNPPTLKLINPMDSFQIMWMKLPILAAVFVSSPWILYQVWAFIAPGLYKKEKRYAVPFVLSSAGLFVLGGFFAYFIAFRYGLEFLLGLGIGKGVDPSVNITEYYDLFVDVMLGVGIIFEIPVLLFLLTLIRVVSPAFLVRHSRYAILVIVTLAAIITPTGDVFNLALFATPMIILFYVGIFAGYLLVLKREKRRFPWGTFLRWTVIVLLVLLGIGWLIAKYYGYHFVPRWPIFVR